jgi:hypothetical protein
MSVKAMGRTFGFALTVWLTASYASAAPILFNDGASWYGAVSQARFATMGGLVPPGQVEYNMPTKTWRDGPIEFSAADPDLMEVIATTPSVPFANPYQSDVINFQGFTSNPTLNVTTSRLSSAIGFQYWTPDWTRAPGTPADAPDLTAILYGLNGIYQYDLTSPLDRMGFFGVTTEDSIYAVHLVAARANGVAIDNFAIADTTPVPEPASLLLLGSSAAMLIRKRLKARRG